MATEEDSNKTWHGDTEGHCFTFIPSSLRESAK